MVDFCVCDECGSTIKVGDDMVSLTLSKDRVDGEFSVQPLEANSIALWCLTCAPKAINRISSVVRPAVHETNENKL